MGKLVNSIAFASLLAMQVLPSPAEARVEKTLKYTKKQSYHAALRFLRLDRGFKIIEKDLDSGYMMFEYPKDGSSEFTSGSIEVIQREKSIALIVRLSEVPHYHERMLASSLLKKLRRDYGEPRSAPKAKGTAPPSESPKADKKQEVASPAPPKPDRK